MRAYQATNRLSISEEDQGGHTLDAYLHGRLQVLVCIHAGKEQLACVGLAQFLEDRCQGAAGWAPGGREIDDHRQRRLQDMLGKILIGDSQYCIIYIHSLFSFLSVEPDGYFSDRYACYRLQWKYTCSS